MRPKTLKLSKPKLKLTKGTTNLKKTEAAGMLPCKLTRAVPETVFHCRLSRPSRRFCRRLWAFGLLLHCWAPVWLLGDATMMYCT
jgi:hypothetical protein